MSVPAINRDSALRIALAARVLPDISVGQLLEVIQSRIQGEINEDALTSLTVTDLKAGFSDPEATEAGGKVDIELPLLKEAVRILWGEQESDALPKVQTLEEIPPRSVRVAISSNTGEILDGHFGSCLRFLVYQVSKDWYQLVDIRSTIDADSAEDRNAFRADLINDCQVLYVVSIGGPAAAKVVRAGVYPIKKADGGEAADVLKQFQGVMSGSIPPWLAKYIGDKPEDRVRFTRDEDIDEASDA